MTTPRRRLPSLRLPSWRLPRDTVAAAGGAAIYSGALGLATVALPLLAVASGYSGAEVGVLTAISALAQMVTRLFLGPLMRVFADRVLVLLAGVLLAVSSGVVAVSAAWLPFVLAELLQGMSRACFWTGSQTHVVRGSGSSVKALAVVNLISSVGMLGGPLLGGLLVERSAQLALAVAAVISVAGCVPPMFLDALPPFTPPANRPPGRLWRRPAVSVGCWVGVVAGAWRGLLGSYVPVALNAAHQSSSVIGALVSVANLTSLIGSGIVGRVRPERLVAACAIGTLTTGLATAAVALFAGWAWLAGLLLGVSGLGAGALQTIGPALASDSVDPQERGDVIAVTGTFRAAALFVTPLGVAGLVTALPVAASMALVGGLIALPVLAIRRLRVA